MFIHSQSCVNRMVRNDEFTAFRIQRVSWCVNTYSPLQNKPITGFPYPKYFYSEDVKEVGLLFLVPIERHQ